MRYSVVVTWCYSETGNVGQPNPEYRECTEVYEKYNGRSYRDSRALQITTIFSGKSIIWVLFPYECFHGKTKAANVCVNIWKPSCFYYYGILQYNERERLVYQHFNR